MLMKNNPHAHTVLKFKSKVIELFFFKGHEHIKKALADTASAILNNIWEQHNMFPSSRDYSLIIPGHSNLFIRVYYNASNNQTTASFDTVAKGSLVNIPKTDVEEIELLISMAKDIQARQTIISNYLSRVILKAATPDDIFMLLHTDFLNRVDAMAPHLMLSDKLNLQRSDDTIKLSEELYSTDIREALDMQFINDTLYV